MKRILKGYALLPVCFVLVIVFFTNCGMRPFGRPTGEFVGSCEGKMELMSGQKVRFIVEAFKVSDGEIKLFFRRLRRDSRYREVTDITYDDGILKVEVNSPRNEYRGKITGDELKFKGEWKEYSGSFVLNIGD